MCSSPHESFNEMESENSVYVCISTSASKRLTFTLTFDCFCLQIAILLSYKVTVILKVLPSHYIEVAPKGNACKKRIQLDSSSLIIARKIALVR